MQWETAYQYHLIRLLEELERGPKVAPGVIFHAGRRRYYHRDDAEIPFRTNPYFARLCPLAGPDHLLLCRAGRPPRLVVVQPRSYWQTPPQTPQHPCLDAMEARFVASAEAAIEALEAEDGCLYVGEDPTTAAALGLAPEAVEPCDLMAYLDWSRSYKTPYEVACLREAARRAARGHQAVRQQAEGAPSERILHAHYLRASGQLETDCPYVPIIAWDAHAGTLHYNAKEQSPPRPGCTLLIDAGASWLGYASDITRTYVRDGGDGIFAELVRHLDALQRELIVQVRPGVPFTALQEQAHRGIAHLLHELGIVRIAAEEAFERGLTRPFFPHGLGHHLGLQVHDVAGRQIDRRGTNRAPPAHYPTLRATRDLEPGHVVTIEPGVYFIPMLLEPLRAGHDARAIDWRLIEGLISRGGARIEDDVLVTESGCTDLTRPLVPVGHVAAREPLGSACRPTSSEPLTPQGVRHSANADNEGGEAVVGHDTIHQPEVPP